VFESIGALLAAFKLPDLRRRLLFVIGAFAVFVAGLHIPVARINPDAMNELMQRGGSLLGLFNVFSGGAFRKFSVFAMGIMPYINASIIFQLLTIASARVQQWAREGEAGRRKISQWTRYLTMILGMVQGTGMIVMFSQMGILSFSHWAQMIPVAITLTAGTAFLMWLGEQITDKGIGNGVSLIIFAGIAAQLPPDVQATWTGLRAGAHSWYNVLFLIAIFVGTVMGIIYVQQGQRKIPVQHAKRVIGQRIYGGTSTYLPLRVNTAGVIPIIFAISVSLFPQTIVSFLSQALPEAWRETANTIVQMSTPSGSVWGAAIYFMLVIFFTYFYTAVTFNVPEVADNMKKTGSYIPGIRPGKPTQEYLDRVMTRITFAGALFLGVIALMQYYVHDITQVRSFQLVGGTSLLIVVGVALETMQQVEAHLVMRHYEGFIK
jgi:preprotein translocase subunit SecY